MRYPQVLLRVMFQICICDGSAKKGLPPSLLIPLKLPNVRPPPSTHGLPWTGWARIGSCCPIWERRVASKKLIHIRASPEITKLKNKAR